MTTTLARKLAYITMATTALLAPVATASIADAAQPTAKTSSFTAEVWADNWFALYANGKKVGQDSVPITTERSFNSEKITFTASYPLTIGILGKDFTENASGLEYIGTPRQQMGDGGVIAQIRDNKTGKIVAVTNGTWKALVINKAPLNSTCVTSSNPLAECKVSASSEPKNWSAASFSTKGWGNASTYTPAEVGVKDGYNEITWDKSAQLIWGSDLKIDNSILFRKTVTSS
jgi:hypothetical protein